MASPLSLAIQRRLMQGTAAAASQDWSIPRVTSPLSPEDIQFLNSHTTTQLQQLPACQGNQTVQVMLQALQAQDQIRQAVQGNIAKIATTAVKAVGDVHADLYQHVPIVGQPAANACRACSSSTAALLCVQPMINELINNGEIGRALGKAAETAVMLPVDLLLLNVVLNHRDVLRVQAQGKWKSLPDELIHTLTPHYEVNLKDVRYAESIPGCYTKETAVTYDNEIFFPSAIDLQQHEDLHWMLHELQHVEQSQKCGSLEAFLQKYFRETASTIIKEKKFDIHDCIPLEQEAEAKASKLIKTLGRT